MDEIAILSAREKHIEAQLLQLLAEKEELEAEIALFEDELSELKLEIAWTEDDNRTTARRAKQKYKAALASDNIPLLNSLYRETSTALYQGMRHGWPVEIKGMAYITEIEARRKRRAVVDRLAEIC